MNWFKRAALIALALAGPVGIATPARAGSWKPDADDALLLDMRAGNLRLGDGVRGYAVPGGACVDFADVILALDIPVRLDKQSRRATGWAFDERHTLTIDRVSGEEHIGNIAGKAATRKVAPDDIRDTPEGWCVAAGVLSRWLGVRLDVDVANALIVVHADQKLPVELAAERRARVARTNVSFDLASLPHASAPYRLRAPSVDVVASAGGVSDRLSGKRVDAQYELYASGEAGPVSYDARLASDRHGVPASLRFRAYRTDPDGGLLGPLHATHVAIGDVQGLSTPLVAQGSIGRGALVTNRPVDRLDNFSKTDLRGELPRGWDAELYRNGQLLAFANDRQDGRYEFLDVPLLYGQNRFEVVLYGPQGQIRREVRSVPVGIESIPPRQTWYWAGIDDDGHDLIDFGRVALTYRRGWRGSLGVERGLDTRTSFAAYVHSLVLDGGSRASYFEGAVRRAVGPALVELSGSQQYGGGTALRGAALAQLGTTNFGVETIWATGGYRSDRVLKDVTGLHEFSIDHSFGEGSGSIPVHLDARYATRSTGDATLDLTSRVSANLGRISVTGELTWSADRRPVGPDPPDRVDAALLANARVGPVRLRGEVRYQVSPVNEFRSATLVGEWNAGSSLLNPAEWRAELGYDRTLHRGRVGVGYARRFDRFALTGTAEAASDGSVAAGLSLAFSIGPDPRRHGGVRVTADKLAAHGSALVRVYRDTNGNGRRDMGEPLEKDVQVSAGHVPVEHLTDAAGEVVVDDLTPFQPILVSVDASSLPDPLVQPSTPGIVVTARPGVAQTIELPLVASGDVDGTLVRSGGAPLEGVDLELVDVEGHVARTTRSDFDGFFLFEGVPYGRYALRVQKLAAEASRIETALPGAIIVGAATPSAHLGGVAARPLARVADISPP